MRLDRVTLHLIRNSLLYASEEMGLAMRNAAYSPNIKERMDHSAAIFDPEGRLLAQAEHIPVHLGSLPWGLRNMIDRCQKEGIAFDEGSMVFANDPYVTGTHLNDVTTLAPIHHAGELVAFAVNKAHHSDVGGKVPGSISADSASLFDEGFVMEPSPLVRNRRILTKAVDEFAVASRTPKERKGDLRAQAAANVTGERRVLQTISKYGLPAFRSASEWSFHHSESLMRRRISRFSTGTYRASDFLEGPAGEDLELRATVRVSRSGVEVDYAGTDREVDYPLNAVFGVTISGVYFVLRCLTGDDVPANHGAFAPVRVSAPKGCLLNPTYPHPVGGGNVETSQRNADAVFRALSEAAPDSVPAAPGGSMNNVMMGGGKGSSSWAFYETIGVGLGGSRAMDGIDGIQCNMTNTMNTPIEEIERSLPVMMAGYEFRPGSSGAGKLRGGCGLVRSYRVLRDDTTFTILADREKHAPWGLRGGKPGKRTEVILRTGDHEDTVPAKSTLVLRAGQVVEVRTAGGGGYGQPKDRGRASILADVENGLLTPGDASKEYGVRASHRHGFLGPRREGSAR